MFKNKLVAVAFLVVAISSCQKEIETKSKVAIAPATNAKIESIAQESTTKAVVSNLLIPFDQTFLVGTTETGEQVHFTGQLHLVARFLPPNPIIPNDPYRITLVSNVMSLKGLGLTTGLIYQIQGSFQTDQPVTPASSFTFDHIYNLLPPNPIIPTDPYNPSDPYRFRFSVQLDNYGSVIDASVLGLGLADIAVEPG